MSDFYNLYYLGPDGSNSHNAVIKFLDICKVNIQNKYPQKSIKFALEKLESDKNSIAVLPIENSIEGLVRETIDNFVKVNDSSIKIQGEITLQIKHILMSKTTNITKIKKIYSHPQAFAQCSNFLYSNFKDAELKEVSSTSYAAEKVSIENDETIAAIANETCSQIFGLNILAKDINDEKDNQTRFYILGRLPLETNDKNKTAIMISPKINRAGVLCDILKIIAKNEINLSYIDSRPSKRHLGEYLFFMELDGSEKEEKIQKAIEELKQQADFLKIFGSFSIYSYM